MTGALRFFGWLFIVAGIIGGIVIVARLDWNHYDIAKRVYAELVDNEFAKASFEQARSDIRTGVTLAVAAGVTGVISGILLLSVARGLDLLTDIREEIRESRRIRGQAVAGQ